VKITNHIPNPKGRFDRCSSACNRFDKLQFF